MILWHGDMMEMTCRVLKADDFHRMYPRMVEDRLLWAFWPQYLDDWWTEEKFVSLLSARDSVVVGVEVDGVVGGFLHLWPYCGSEFTKAGEVGVCAFRKYFPLASQMCRVVVRYVFSHFDCSCLIGHIPVHNIHALRMLESVGFTKVCRVPEMGYFARKDRFSDGWLVNAVPERREV